MEEEGTKSIAKVPLKDLVEAYQVVQSHYSADKSEAVHEVKSNGMHLHLDA